jgi:hypothetical protein
VRNLDLGAGGASSGGLGTQGVRNVDLAARGSPSGGLRAQGVRNLDLAAPCLVEWEVTPL